PSRWALTSRLLMLPPAGPSQGRQPPPDPKILSLRDWGAANESERRGRISWDLLYGALWRERRIDERAQRPITLLRILEARRDGRVLLRFDHEPAAIVDAFELVDYRGEIDRAVARHGECAVDHGFEKAPVAIASELHDGGPHVLAVHMANACGVGVDERNRIAAGKCDVPGV